MGLFFLASDLRLMREIYQKFVHPNQDRVTAWEERFNEIKKNLPSEGIIGYATYFSPELKLTTKFDETAIDVQTMREYYMTQYTLTPHIIDTSLKHDFVITASREGVPMVIQNRAEWLLIKDYGDGLVLYKHQKEIR